MLFLLYYILQGQFATGEAYNTKQETVKIKIKAERIKPTTNIAIKKINKAGEISF